MADGSANSIAQDVATIPTKEFKLLIH